MNPLPISEDLPDSQRTEFGRRLRNLRQERGWTLSQLAERSGLAVSTISKAERGLISLTYDRMLSLARGIGVDMAEFFEAKGDSFARGSFAVAPKGQFQRQETPTYVYEMLFPEIRHKAMVPMLGTLKAHDIMDFDDFVRHPGQEFLMVLEGAVTVYAEGKTPATLRQGDCIYFDSSRGHLYASAGAEDARILLVCTESEVAAQSIPKPE